MSPIHGDLHGLPPVTVFTGTADLLNPDSRRLAAACAGQGVACELVEQPDMPHVYALLPTPEGRAARRRIVALLEREVVLGQERSSTRVGHALDTTVNGTRLVPR